MATMRDLDDLALSLPDVTRVTDDGGRGSYTVGGKAFVFHRSPRPDALDPDTGERLEDVLVFHVADLDEKELVLADPRGVFFATPHWNGYSAVLMRISRLGALDHAELAELVSGAWLARAPKRLAKAWLTENGV
jgi:hypothetical protein